MEHADLVAEMAHVEHLSTQERLHLARRRRLQQLKAWSQREKKWSGQKVTKSGKHIFFSDSVMLLEAAARNDIDEVRRLLMKGVSPDSTNEDGLTALHQCCIDDNEEMMKLLIEYGANVNAEDSEKWTPLHAAATCGHLHLVRYLISRGSNLLAVNADGNMPYDICEDEAALDYIEGEMARRGVTQELIDETRAATELQMLKDLHQLSAESKDLEAYDHQGATPLHIAAANGYLRVVEFLLDHNVATNVKDNDDWQPVHAAACWGHLEVLELLVQHGADLNAKTKHDETPAAEVFSIYLIFYMLFQASLARAAIPRQKKIIKIRLPLKIADVVICFQVHVLFGSTVAHFFVYIKLSSCYPCLHTVNRNDNEY
ncbi:hypothetical protein L9F63_016233, partial [Diploptera punctata]